MTEKLNYYKLEEPERERVVRTLMADDGSNKSVAKALGTKPNTIASYRHAKKILSLRSPGNPTREEILGPFAEKAPALEHAAPKPEPPALPKQKLIAPAKAKPKAPKQKEPKPKPAPAPKPAAPPAEKPKPVAKPVEPPAPKAGAPLPAPKPVAEVKMPPTPPKPEPKAETVVAKASEPAADYQPLKQRVGSILNQCKAFDEETGRQCGWEHAPGSEYCLIPEHQALEARKKQNARRA